ncbi:MAG: tryptophanase [Armatimonadetes bacterium]|nr:tryptophanase [Armatimonadota bacterium]
MNVRLTDGRDLPIEMHKVRIVQRTRLAPAAERLAAMQEAGYNTFLLRTRDVFIDMLTDSGTNAMSDCQLAAMMVADDAYAGGESYYRLADAIRDVLGLEHFLPVHQGRAAEHLIAKTFVKPGHKIITNYHFTTTRAHFELMGGEVLELYTSEALKTASTHPFKGNMDTDRLEAAIAEHGADAIPFIRMECTTNLIGGQPFSMANLREVSRIARNHGIMLILDTSLISENAYFIKRREPEFVDASIGDIVKAMLAEADMMYMSGRKSTCVRGGFIATNRRWIFDAIRPWLPVYEGFLTYGGMSSKEIEAMAVGLREMTDLEVASSSADLIAHFVARMVEEGIPAVTPPGGLAGHVDASKLLPHLPQTVYPAGALAAAVYLTSGVRTMERGTVSTDRDVHGNEVMGDLELARFAVPRRVYTMSHIEYVVDRLKWLKDHADLVGGLRFVEEPPVLRFFFGKMEDLGGWGARLTAAFEKDFGPEA